MSKKRNCSLRGAQPPPLALIPAWLLYPELLMLRGRTGVGALARKAVSMDRIYHGIKARSMAKPKA
jgi:hypothetical protein